MCASLWTAGGDGDGRLPQEAACSQPVARADNVRVLISTPWGLLTIDERQIWLGDLLLSTTKPTMPTPTMPKPRPSLCLSLSLSLSPSLRLSISLCLRLSLSLSLSLSLRLTRREASERRGSSCETKAGRAGQPEYVCQSLRLAEACQG